MLSGAAAHGLRCALGVVRLACVIASGRRVQAIAVEAGMLALRANHTELKHEDFVQVHTRYTMAPQTTFAARCVRSLFCLRRAG